MRLQELSMSKWAATLALAAGLASYQAAAIGELVVYGTDTSVVSAPTHRDLKHEMGIYIEALNIAQKASIDAALAKKRSAEIQIAAAKIPTRG